MYSKWKCYFDSKVGEHCFKHHTFLSVSYRQINGQVRLLCCALKWSLIRVTLEAKFGDIPKQWNIV